MISISEQRTWTWPKRNAARSAEVPVQNADSAPILPVLTAVVWIGCVTIGELGFALDYRRPRPQTAEPPAIVAETISVQLDPAPVPRPERVAPEDQNEPAPMFLTDVPPEAPPLVAVAEPATVAFALPVEGPVQVVATNRAVRSRELDPTVRASPAAPPVQSITYGHGEGRQPAPEYPWQAKRQGQEGTVVVRLFVGADGRVLNAQAVRPSPWPLLNEAAVQTIRDRWRFPGGARRLYEVAIRFELKK